MTAVKVRHAGIRYTIRKDGKSITEAAFRGQVIEDMPSGEAQRLIRAGAVVDASTELTLPGRLMPLPSTSSDAELVAWASVANRDDILAACREQPMLADRIMAAYEEVQRQLAAQNDLLGGLKPDLEKIQEEQERAAADERDRQAKADAEARRASDEAGQEAERLALLNPTGQPAPTGEQTSGADDELEDPDDVVKGNVAKVSQYIGAHPDQASEIMDAENRRAAADGADPANPRQGVIHAVAAAAAHNTQ